MGTGEARVRRSPAHAGHLPAWERLALTFVLALIAAGIGLAVVSGSTQPPAAQHVTGRSAGAHPAPRGPGSAGGSAATAGTPASLTPSPSGQSQPSQSQPSQSQPSQSQPGQAGGRSR